MFYGTNPCECCKIRKNGRCDGLGNNDCVLNTWGHKSCSNSECMLNFEGEACLIGIEDKCGANPEADVEWMDEELD